MTQSELVNGDDVVAERHGKSATALWQGHRSLQAADCELKIKLCVD